MPRHAINSLTFYSGSTLGQNKNFATEVNKLGQYIASQNITTVYGGGKVGLMGELATSTMEAGGKVIGIMPQKLIDDELAHETITDLEVVETMHERKARMADLADGFVVLPGGAGTLEEFFEMWTWQQIGIHTKPVALYNIDGFWDTLLKLLHQLHSDGFLRKEYIESLIIAETPEDLVEQFKLWEPPAPKWDLIRNDENENY